MSGILSDKEILENLRNGILISEEWEEKNIKQTCYELRVGNTYYDLNDEAKKYEITENGEFILKPHQRIVVITKEKLVIPNDYCAKIITKGVLFSIGISPVCTYADPGFQGRLGIVIQNLSNEYLRITNGMAIAKIEFNKLENSVERPYCGQHGYETEIWPIKKDMFVCKEDVHKGDELEEIEYAFGENVAGAFKRVLYYEKRMLFLTSILIVINLIIMGFMTKDNFLQPILSVTLAILSNVIYGVVVMLLTRKRKK